MKNFTLVILIFSFLGCSTSNNVSTVSNLQVKISQIENRMRKREQELEKLKYEVREIAQIVEGFDGIQDSDDFDGMKIEEPVLKKPIVKSRIELKKKGIIRVLVKVNVLQEALSKAGYYDGSIDGKLGSKTRKAILEFQKDHGLVADGIIGKKTWNEMKVYLEE